MEITSERQKYRKNERDNERKTYAENERKNDRQGKHKTEINSTDRNTDIHKETTKQKLNERDKNNTE